MDSYSVVKLTIEGWVQMSALVSLRSAARAAILLLLSSAAHANAKTVIWLENNVSAIDTAQPDRTAFDKLGGDVQIADWQSLPAALEAKETDLLVLPYGSVFPVKDWSTIYQYLERGGNLITLGGKPFTRPAVFEAGAWNVLPENYGLARQLFLSDYQPTPGSAGLEQVWNDDVWQSRVAKLKWSSAFSPVIRLSDEEAAQRIGASGTQDAKLITLLWGKRQQRKLSAPIVQIDHFRNHFVGGRWVMVNCELDSANALASLLKALIDQAKAGATLFRVTPRFALFLPGEPWQFQVDLQKFNKDAQGEFQVDLAVMREGKLEAEQKSTLSMESPPHRITMDVTPHMGTGFREVTVRLLKEGKLCGIYRTGFWIRDRAYLLSGPKVTVDKDFFQVNGSQLQVVGTTYMASDAQRLFFRYPNPYVWDSDMNQIAGAGLNMLRTGWWTDWDTLTDGTAIATEQTLRTMEAFLMTARKHNLPVQWTLFAFMPDVFGGGNPYLSAEALRREQTFVASVASPFKDMPFLMWDLINEPSFDNPKRFFTTRPNGDADELRQWNLWLKQTYGSTQQIEAAWRTVLPAGDIPVPAEADFSLESANDGGRPLATYDFERFAQDRFAAWTQAMRRTIASTGSSQLITVGQDEGGELTSPSPAYFKSQVDFTTVHTWWMYDNILWATLAAKQQGRPMLVQETGVQHEFDADGQSRRTPENEAALVERKIGVGLATGAGAIEWLWNINAQMRSQQEVTIGAIRPDGTERPEASVLESYAQFAGAIANHLKSPEPEEVVILTSQALQYSTLHDLAVQAQGRAVRVMNYLCHVPTRIVAENNAAEIRGSRLVVLPSPQALQGATWQTLLAYVEAGGNLLVTGPVERDEHWQRTSRLSDLGIQGADASALNFHGSTLNLLGEQLDVGFAQNIQQRTEALNLAGGTSYLEVKKGKGTIFLVALPVELAESPQPTREVYRHVLGELNIEPEYQGQTGSSSVLIRPTILADSILYLVLSESAQDEVIDIKDKITGAEIKITLPAQRVFMTLLSRKDGHPIASYAPPMFRIE